MTDFCLWISLQLLRHTEICANTFDFKGMQETAGPGCQPAALSLCAARANPGDEGAREYSNANTLLNLY